MREVSLHEVARYYRDMGLVGESRSAITATVALAGGASVIVRGESGTGKTVLQDIAVSLYPEDKVAVIDMLSKLGIYSKGMVERIVAVGKNGLVVFPEDQNASDNDEMVKVKKKWGDNKSAKREKSEDYGAKTSVTELPPRKFISTAALSNTAHERTFDLESARRVIKVATDPAEDATSEVLDYQADWLVHGEAGVKVLSALQRRAVVKHANLVYGTDHGIKRVRFFGAHALKSAIPKVFPETRSAFALFAKVLLGTGRWYHASEVVVDGEVYLSPQRAAEAWSFYADTLQENALRLEAGDRVILDAFPQPSWNGNAIAPECWVDLTTLMRKLRPKGITDKAFVKRQVGKLITKGFVTEASGANVTRLQWHRTDLADAANRADWEDVISECRKHAKKHLKGDPLKAYLRKCDDAASKGMQNPLTGQTGPIYGEESVLYFDHATGEYARRNKTGPRGLFTYGE